MMRHALLSLPKKHFWPSRGAKQIPKTNPVRSLPEKKKSVIGPDDTCGDMERMEAKMITKLILENNLI